ERERLIEAYVANQIERFLEVRSGLAGEPHDEVGRQHHVGPCLAQAPRNRFELEPGVAAVHGWQDTVAARLARQANEGHALRPLAMRLDEARGHFLGM